MSGARPEGVAIAPEAIDPAAVKELVEGLQGLNERFLGPHKGQNLFVVARGVDGALLGGALGKVWIEWAAIDLLWLHESVRGRGLGRALLAAAEAEARRLGANRVLLDTLGFQAEGFYLKAGYVEFGRIPSFLNGYDRIYLRKDLAGP